jgi:hypothetical protein
MPVACGSRERAVMMLWKAPQGVLTTCGSAVIPRGSYHSFDTNDAAYYTTAHGDYFFGCAVGGRMPFRRRYDAAVE